MNKTFIWILIFLCCIPTYAQETPQKLTRAAQVQANPKQLEHHPALYHQVPGTLVSSLERNAFQQPQIYWSLGGEYYIVAIHLSYHVIHANSQQKVFQFIEWQDLLTHAQLAEHFPHTERHVDGQQLYLIRMSNILLYTPNIIGQEKAETYWEDPDTGLLITPTQQYPYHGIDTPDLHKTKPYFPQKRRIPETLIALNETLNQNVLPDWITQHLTKSDYYQPKYIDDQVIAFANGLYLRKEQRWQAFTEDLIWDHIIGCDLKKQELYCINGRLITRDLQGKQLKAQQLPEEYNRAIPWADGHLLIYNMYYRTMALMSINTKKLSHSSKLENDQEEFLYEHRYRDPLRRYFLVRKKNEFQLRDIHQKTLGRYQLPPGVNNDTPVPKGPYRFRSHVQLSPNGQRLFIDEWLLPYPQDLKAEYRPLFGSMRDTQGQWKPVRFPVEVDPMQDLIMAHDEGWLWIRGDGSAALLNDKGEIDREILPPAWDAFPENKYKTLAKQTRGAFRGFEWERLEELNDFQRKSALWAWRPVGLRRMPVAVTPCGKYLFRLELTHEHTHLVEENFLGQKSLRTTQHPFSLKLYRLHEGKLINSWLIEEEVDVGGLFQSYQMMPGPELQITFPDKYHALFNQDQLIRLRDGWDQEQSLQVKYRGISHPWFFIRTEVFLGGLDHPMQQKIDPAATDSHSGLFRSRNPYLYHDYDDDYWSMNDYTFNSYYSDYRPFDDRFLSITQINHTLPHARLPLFLLGTGLFALLLFMFSILTRRRWPHARVVFILLVLPFLVLLMMNLQRPIWLDHQFVKSADPWEDLVMHTKSQAKIEDYAEYQRILIGSQASLNTRGPHERSRTRNQIPYVHEDEDDPPYFRSNENLFQVLHRVDHPQAFVISGNILQVVDANNGKAISPVLFTDEMIHDATLSADARFLILRLMTDAVLIFETKKLIPPDHES